MTRILRRSELERVLGLGPCLDALRTGFQADSRTPMPSQRLRTDLPGPGTATALLPGLLPKVDAFTIKVNAKFPESDPALRGVVCLFDSRDGSLLAILDSATITAWRTGLAAALATDLLTRRQPSIKVAVIGAGAQADLMLRGLAHLREIHSIKVHDRVPSAANAFIARHANQRVTAITTDTTTEAVAEVDVILVATWARESVIGVQDVRPGQHITTIGSDEPGKQELSPNLLRLATMFVDNRDLATTIGAAANAGLPGDAVAATLGDVHRATHPGRTNDDEITVYAPVGVPWQDLALAFLAYRRAENEKLGSDISLHA